jgi:radical SAM protein with 4Fe4S-binding SPASM domain
LDRAPAAAARLSVVVTLAPPYDLDSVMTFFADQAPWSGHDPARWPALSVNFADIAGFGAGRWGQPENGGGAEGSAALCAASARRRYLQARLEGGGKGVDPVLAALCDRPLVRLHRRRRGRPEAVPQMLGCCLPGQRRLHVRVDGALQPCERVGDSLVIGRLPDGIDLVLARALDERLQAALGDRCRDCWAARLCDLCYTVLAPLESTAGERALPVLEEVCVETRARIEEDLRLYLRLWRGGGAATAFLETAVLS